MKTHEQTRSKRLGETGEKKAVRKPYHPPTVTDHGTVSEMTKTGSSSELEYYGGRN
jgi:hypothetical protein